MKLSPLRLLHIGSLAGMHIALVGIVLFMLGAVGQGVEQPKRWPQLTVWMGIAILANRPLSRLPLWWRRKVGLVGGLLSMSLLLKWLLGGGLSLTTGWEQFSRLDYTESQELFFGVGALLYLWWRGLNVADFDQDNISKTFRRGVVTIMIALPSLQFLFGAPFSHPQVLSTLTAYIVAFITSSLLALAFTNVLGRGNNVLQQRWMPSTVLPVTVLVGLGLILSAIFSNSLRSLLFEVWDILLVTAYWIISPIVFILITTIGWAAQSITLPQPAIDLTPTPAPMPLVLDPIQRVHEMYPEPPTTSTEPFWRIIEMLLWFTIAAFALYWTLTRQGRLYKDEAEERVSIWSWAEVKGDLQGILGSLLASLHRKRQGLRAALAALHGNDPTTRIKRAYIQLLLLGEEQEQGRLPSQTPREYQPLVEELAPNARPAVAELTAAYEEARYGPTPSAQRAAKAEEALTAVRKDVQRAD